MKLLIVLSALVAVALATPGYLGAGAYLGAAGVAPVIGSAPGLVAPQPPAPVVVGGLAAYGPANIVLGPEGVPLDTPAVAAARVQHLSARLAVQSRGSV
ncbi:cuticle protein 18.7-like [Schistocerca serialis cubense]|uniref:cuticle protein 18.7-like n=1 Tax=Schistocerca serialis cubense TaxID=2023355 RepID=UPI00214E42E4|nr:cuticle protein 18.7-like [Schistocerca serialis cubense]